MARCPKCGAENYINCCELCGFEQTRDVLSYYTLTRLSDEDLSFFDTTECIIRQCAKQLELLNGFIRVRGSENPKAHEELAALWDEYIRLSSPKPIDKYSGMSANELNDLALEYYNGSGEKEQDFVKAFELFSLAAEKGNADAMCNLGDMYYYGQGVTRDYARAIEWYTKAAENGNADAMYNLGVLYYFGVGVPQDYARAFEWYTKAAENGDAKAMNDLGNMYYYGKGVSWNFARAFEWYQKAAEKGNAKAMNNLGYMYYWGKGVTQDYARAFEWYTKAAEKGDAFAMDNLAKMYKKGQGVARDKQKAEEWKRKAEAARR